MNQTAYAKQWTEVEVNCPACKHRGTQKSDHPIPFTFCPGCFGVQRVGQPGLLKGKEFTDFLKSAYGTTWNGWRFDQVEAYAANKPHRLHCFNCNQPRCFSVEEHLSLQRRLTIKGSIALICAYCGSLGQFTLEQATTPLPQAVVNEMTSDMLDNAWQIHTAYQPDWFYECPLCRHSNISVGRKDDGLPDSCERCLRVFDIKSGQELGVEAMVEFLASEPGDRWRWWRDSVIRAKARKAQRAKQ